ncbi:unnamed protein product [Acanthoscelides obtectus]|uniref:C2H2-type domain-containing protein n=1 Tax=Acanthoscelides obtectus TaxID=200917 RepID=A0A9P0JW63_ACAOB|nr:unnamed protein product [Acanthoscelides obtectus]CAK1663831.1 hypothetical protein AOBTE_LOCUS23877 [Acanthoscelides obtectus]
MSVVYETTDFSHICAFCRNNYSSQSNLNRHLREKHESEIVVCDEYGNSYKCLEGCNFSFNRRGGLLYHLENTHHIPIEQEEMHFSSRNEFLEWMKSVEDHDNVQYVKQRTFKKLHTPTCYYTCSRSGRIDFKQGSNKRKGKPINMGIRCISGIKYFETQPDKIKVIYHKTHYGHDCDNENFKTKCQDPQSKDADSETTLKIKELKKCVNREFKILSQLAEQSSDAQALQRLHDMLLEINAVFQTPSAKKTRHISPEHITDLFVEQIDKRILFKNLADDKVLVVQHDHGYS